MALASLTEQLRKQLTENAAISAAESNHALIVDDNDEIDWEESTLHEAIESDRRLTTRNIIRWLDQIIAWIQTCHRAYVSVGDFGVLDVKVGHRAAVAASVQYSEAFTAWLKLGNDAVNSRFDTGDPSLSSTVTKADSERIAVLDFHRRVRLFQQATFGHKHGPQSAQDKLTRLPRSFESQKMLRFDYRHDNTIIIGKEHAFHDSLVATYREFAGHIWRDLRCLGIVILQIYTLSVFSHDEVERLMHWPVPEEAKHSEESEGEEDSTEQHQQQLKGRAGDRRRSSVGVTSLATMQQNRRGSATAGDSAPSAGNATVRRSSTSGGKQLTINTAAAPATALTAPSTATTTPSAGAGPKRRVPRCGGLPGPLEQSLLPFYPCLARMPAEVKDLLLTVCFTRPEKALSEGTVRRSGEVSTRVECPLLKLLKESKAELHELAEKLDADCHYAPQSYWTPADERARLAAIQERQGRMARLAEQGPAAAMARLKRDRYLLWYSMQTDEFREKLEARKRARKKAAANTVKRRKFIFQASFQHWNMVTFTYWVQEALLDYSALLLEHRNTALFEKKQHKKNPAVHIMRLMNDLAAMYSETAVAKLTAYQALCLEQDAASWARNLAFIRPSTLGGDRRALARTELDTVGLVVRPKPPEVPEPVATEEGGAAKAKAAAQGKVKSAAGRTTQDPSRIVKASKEEAQLCLPAIEGQRGTAEGKPRQRWGAKSAGTDATPVVKEQSAEEVLHQCFATMAATMARLLLQKDRTAYTMCENFRKAVAAQQKDEATAVSDRVLITSEEQLYYKRIYEQAKYLASYLKPLRNQVIEFSDLIDLVDRGWVRHVMHLVTCAMMNHFHKYAPSRGRGENYAADRLVAFFRGIVVRNIVSRVWQRTKLLMASSLSPSLSSKGGFARNSPASTHRKHMGMGLATRSGDSRDTRYTVDGSRHTGMGLATRSGDSRDTRVTFEGSRHSAPSGNQSVGLNHGMKVRHKASGEKRKPLCFRSVTTPTAQSVVIDLSVSIESDDSILQGTATATELSRLSQRYEDWRKVCCVGYIETRAEDEPDQLSASQVVEDSGMFVAGGAGHSRPQKVEQHVKRRLVLSLFSHTNRRAIMGTDALTQSIVAGSAQSGGKTRRYPVKVTVEVADGIPTDPITHQADFLQGFHGGSVSMRARAQSNAEEAWDDRSIESLSVFSGRRPRTSSFPNSSSEPTKHASHTVVSYRISIADALAFSCYGIQLELDRTLAADLREGNKAYFRYLSLADENDEISVNSDDSLKHVKFVEAGWQWGVAVEETVEVVEAQPVAGAEGALRALPDLEVMRVELEQYVYTRPGVPRTVKALTGRTAYNSADLLAVTRQSGSSGPGPSGTWHRQPSAPQSVLLYATLYLPDLAPQTTPSDALPAALVFNPEVREDVQGCVILHWRHSIEDSHHHTHYEVQRRLLLISSAPPDSPPPPARVASPSGTKRAASRGQAHQPHPRGRADADKATVTAAANHAASFSTEEMVYIGPWQHVAGLKGSLADTRKRNSAKKPTTANAKKVSLQPLWSFPLHANSCTDKVSLPEELDANPDAYNCAIGFLCARFPDLVVQAASQLSMPAAIPSDDASLHGSTGSVGKLSNHSSLKEGVVYLPNAELMDEDGEAVWRRVVPSGLRIAYEYRVRAINSAGVGKFNSTTSVAGLESTLGGGGQKPVKLCVVPVALVCANLGALRDVRVSHPRYRSQNGELVASVLTLHHHLVAQRLGTADFVLIEPSGDVFVEHLMAAKDRAARTAGGGGEGRCSGAMETVSPEAAEGPEQGQSMEDQQDQDEEDPEIGAWLRELALECPLKLL